MFTLIIHTELEIKPLHHQRAMNIYTMARSPRPMQTTPYETKSPNMKVAKIKVSEKYDNPKQFLLKNEDHSDPEDYLDSESDYEDEIRFYVKNSAVVRDKANDLFAGSPDLDFMMPSRVREVLRSEGVSSHVIDRAIQTGEKRHRMALHLTVQQQKYFEYIFVHISLRLYIMALHFPFAQVVIIYRQ